MYGFGTDTGSDNEPGQCPGSATSDIFTPNANSDFGSFAPAADTYLVPCSYDDPPFTLPGSLVDMNNTWVGYDMSGIGYQPSWMTDIPPGAEADQSYLSGEGLQRVFAPEFAIDDP